MKIKDSRIQLRGKWSPPMAVAAFALSDSLRYVLTLALAVALAITPQMASANTQLIANAQKMLSSGNPKGAFQALISEQDKLAGNPQYDYLLGVAALDSGRIDDAIIAFERVLAVEPNNAGALLDLGRAYYLAGTVDLAESTFLQLRQSNPPDAAKGTIEKYLSAIAERKQQGKKSLTAWGETSLGYDSNITGVPNDFTSAVVSAFNIPGVDATGNSIKRKAPYLGAAAGVDFVFPFRTSWSAIMGAEVKGRAYRRQGDYNSLFGEARAGAGWGSGVNAVKILANAGRFSQDGQAPGDPRPTNDRKTAGVSGDYRYLLNEQQQLTAGLSHSWVRFPSNDIEDFNATAFSLGWLRNFSGSGSPVLQINGFFSRDEAVRKLADGIADKSKRVSGLRTFYQYSLTEKIALFNLLGYTFRRDQSSFARATEVEIGRDKLADITVGINWRFQPKCSMRAQWFGSRNDSNIAIYEYSRNELSSNIRCDFN